MAAWWRLRCTQWWRRWRGWKQRLALERRNAYGQRGVADESESTVAHMVIILRDPAERFHFEVHRARAGMVVGVGGDVISPFTFDSLVDDIICDCGIMTTGSQRTERVMISMCCCVLTV